MKKLIFIICFFLLVVKLMAQESTMPVFWHFGADNKIQFEKLNYTSDSTHTAFWPVDLKTSEFKLKSFKGKKVYYSPIIKGIGFFPKNGFQHFGNAKIGIVAGCNFLRKFSWHIAIQNITDNQSPNAYSNQPVYYAHQSARKSDRRWFDYADIHTYLAYQPSQYFTFQVGRGTNFIGDGYRSLFLSENAGAYNQAKMIAKVWNLKYLFLISQGEDYGMPSHKLNAENVHEKFGKQWAATHVMSWNLNNWLNMYFFESVTWENTDSVGTRGLDVNYLNPVIFFRPVEFSIGSPDNMIMGLGGKLQILKKTYLYGQLLLDEFLLSHVREQNGWWGNKYGLQAGVKSFDVFNLPLYVQGEVNYVRPFTYSHENAFQNYALYGSPLAHPRGANFQEALFRIQYSLKKINFSFKTVFCQYGLDTDEKQFGSNLYTSYDFIKNNVDLQFGYETAGGEKHDLLYNELKVSYLIYPKLDIRIEAGVSSRIDKTSEETKSNVNVFFGLRSNWAFTEFDY